MSNLNFQRTYFFLEEYESMRERAIQVLGKYPDNSFQINSLSLCQYYLTLLIVFL